MDAKMRVERIAVFVRALALPLSYFARVRDGMVSVPYLKGSTNSDIVNLMIFSAVFLDLIIVR